ncbi:hypothetical protein HPP92_006892 [Vanilla planifolia]|uniref:Uncharacterized protein n=1 Tax=Vanilla planifolia TaxID=51239 RepID=A0A835V770_VANPL|nr:hypothetical protein HPP92_006892 [Vanilla planifolia]
MVDASLAPVPVNLVPEVCHQHRRRDYIHPASVPVVGSARKTRLACWISEIAAPIVEEMIIEEKFDLLPF